MDSLAKVELLMECTRDVHLNVTSAEVPAILDGTAGDLWQQLRRLQHGTLPSEPPRPDDALWLTIRRAVARHNGLSVDDVGPSTRIAS